MESKILQVYFGNDCLPYKDKERVVHFPIIGNAFQGASATTEIKFYIDQISLGDSAIWIAVSKLPNGQVGYNRLEVDSDDDGTFVTLSLSRWHTQYKGDLYINLQCYDGGIELEEDEDNGILVPVGVPAIQVTGSIKLSINYATGIIDGGDIETHTLQEVWAYFGEFLRNDSNKYMKVVEKISYINSTDTYKDNVKSGDIVFDKEQGTFFLISGSYPTFSWSTVDMYFDELGIDIELNVTNAQVLVGDWDSIYSPTNDENLEDYIDRVVSTALNDYVTLATSQTISGAKTFSSTITANNGVLFGNGKTADLYNGLIRNNLVKLFAIGTNEGNRTYYAFPYGSITDNTHGESNPYTLATEDYVQSYVSDYAYSKEEIKSLLSSVYKPQGTKTVAQINALTPTSEYNGYVYNVSDSGNITIGTQGSLSVVAGDNVVLLWDADNNTYSFDKLAGTIDLSGYVTTIALETTLGGYVQKTQTIASIALSSNISSQDLTNALVFATNEDIESIMED